MPQMTTPCGGNAWCAQAKRSILASVDEAAVSVRLAAVGGTPATAGGDDYVGFIVPAGAANTFF